MKKVITFSLWGSIPKYTIGALKNAKIAKEIYPDFECWFYIHQPSVPVSIIQTLVEMDNVRVILRHGDLNTSKPMMWRFEAIDNPEVEIMMPRDTDTRILPREKIAVQQWLEEKTLFHLMRDHPHHQALVMCGMFGTRKIPCIPSWTNAMNNWIQQGHRDYDTHFMDVIYPYVVVSSTIHATFNKIEPHAKNFPIDYDPGLRFVGEYVDENENRSQFHHEVLKNAISKA